MTRRSGQDTHKVAVGFVGLAILSGMVGGCITDPELKIRLDETPQEIGDGWEISSPEAEGLRGDLLSAALDRFYADGEYHNAVSLLIARHGKLVLEAYARSPKDRDVKRNIQSATKSVTSLVFGIARDLGYFPDLEEPVSDLIPEDFSGDPRKEEITLRDLLTMRSGILFDNDRFSVEILVDRPRDPIRYILGKPLYASPGDSFYYRDADPHLLSGVVTRVTGETLEEIAADHLFAPLGIRDFHWERDSQGNALGSAALFLRPRDLAKIGEMVLRGGRAGRCAEAECQLVSVEWIAASTAQQTRSADPEFPYGFYWWLLPELGGFTAYGHGGQFITVIPEKDLVIVMTSLPSTDDDVVGTTLDRFMPLARILVSAAN
jgi:CubicO group peptidase (beta-lactamase class C family)